MIAASALLLLAGLVLLIAGVFQEGLGMIYGSIVATLLAALFLIMGVVKDRRVRGAAVDAAAGTVDAVRTRLEEMGATEEAEAEEAPATLALASEPEAAGMGTMEAEEEPAETTPAAKRRAAAARRTTTRATGAGKGAAKTAGAAPKRAAATSEKVVVIPDRDKYHKESCRYAKGEGAMTLTKAQAKRQGYNPCGVCKS